MYWPSTSGSGRTSRAPEKDTSLRRSPRRDTGRSGSKSSSRPTSQNQRDPSSGLDTASSRRGPSPTSRGRGRGSLGALLGVGRGRGTMPPPSNPLRAPGLSNQPANLVKEATPADDACQPMELETSYSCSDSAGEHQGPRPFGGHQPGRGPVPSGVDTMVLLSGEH